VPFVDARASALSWWLGDDAPPPLATLVLTGAAGTSSCACSARATTCGVRGSGALARGRRVRPAATGLPDRHDRAVDGGRYRFASATTSYAPAQLARVARDLRRRATGAPDALVGVSRAARTP
jgi:hypothetical protein